MVSIPCPNMIPSGGSRKRRHSLILVAFLGIPMVADSFSGFAPTSTSRAQVRLHRKRWALFDSLHDGFTSEATTSANQKREEDSSVSSDVDESLLSMESGDIVDRNGKANGKNPEPVNGTTQPEMKRNGKSESAPNGERPKTNGVAKNGSNHYERMAPTAPEVNKWTTIMSDGANTVFRRFRSSSKQQKSEAEALGQIYNDLKDMSQFDQMQVNRYWDRLMPQVSYLGTEQVAKIYNALRVAYRAHRGQMRKSGEPFIIHPVEVALLLAGLKMDGETVMSGLLHDTVEDTDLTFTQIEAIFGHVVRSIVEGETKVSKLPKLAFSDYADEQAENLRQMFVAMTDDYRIIIVKLADRLHNMRTLRYMKPEKQIKISRETLDIFAPLAHRMGIWQFKSELEDTAFMYLYPQEYKRLNRRLRQHQTKFRDTLKKSKDILRETLMSDPTLRERATFQVHGRTKELYSLWHKMETRAEHNLDHIMDVVALRVILTPKEEEDLENENEADRGVWLCYHVLGLVQHLPGFQPMPTRVKDYISFPKPNGYQSLHTALMLNGQTIEVQIRTSAMHQVAEYGMASHWAYTDQKKRTLEKTDLYNTPWLSSIKEWQNDIVCSRDFVDSVRRELLGKRVFVFLRNGKILNLARGATAIDAAFAIHTEVGLKMHGVEINGKPVPFSYELCNGDVVSILTGDGKPSTDWMRYAKSRSTRSKLRSYFRGKQRESLREAGEILVTDYLWMHGPLIKEASFMSTEFAVPNSIEGLAPFLPGKTRISDVDELLIAVGKKHDRLFLHTMMSKIFLVPLSTLLDAEKREGGVLPNSVILAVHESRQNAKDAARAAASAQEPPLQSIESLHQPNATLQTDLFDDDDDNMAAYADSEHICKDCLPVHGDEIVGTAPADDDDDGIVTVHRVGCVHAQQAINSVNAAKRRATMDKEDYVGRIDSVKLREEAETRFSTRRESMYGSDDVPVKLQWSEFSPVEDERFQFLAEVVVVAGDRKLLLADCSEVVSENCEILKTGSSSSEEHATLVFLIHITSLDHLQKIMDSLSQIRSVMSVERRFGSELM